MAKEQKGKIIPLTKKQFFLWAVFIFAAWCLFVGVYLYNFIPEWKEWKISVNQAKIEEAADASNCGNNEQCYAMQYVKEKGANLSYSDSPSTTASDSSEPSDSSEDSVSSDSS